MSDYPLDETGIALMRVIADRPRRLAEVYDVLELDDEARSSANMQLGVLGAQGYVERNSVAADAEGDPFNALAITEKGRAALAADDEVTLWEFTDDDHAVIIDSLRTTRDRLQEQGIDTPNVESALRKMNAMAVANQTNGMAGQRSTGFLAVTGADEQTGIEKMQKRDWIQRFPDRRRR